MTETETYRIEIQASNASGAIWQTMRVEYVPRKIALADVAPVSEFDLRAGVTPVTPGIVWEPFNANADIGGLPRIMYWAHRIVSTQDLAEDTAQNQNIADGEGWRVRVYHGDDDTHVAEAGPGADGISATELAARINALGSLSPLERAVEANALANDARVALARMRRAAVYETTRALPWIDVARALGVSPAAINQLVTRHRASAQATNSPMVQEARAAYAAQVAEVTARHRAAMTAREAGGQAPADADPWEGIGTN